MGSLPRALWPHDVVVWVRSSAQGGVQRRSWRTTTARGEVDPTQRYGFLLETPWHRSPHGDHNDAGPGELRRHERRRGSWRTTTTRGEVVTSQRYGFSRHQFLPRNHNVLDFVLSGRQLFGIFLLEGVMLLVVLVFLVCLEDDSVIGWCRTFGIFFLSGKSVVMSLAVLGFFWSHATGRGRHRVLGSVPGFPFLSFGAVISLRLRYSTLI